MVVRKSPQIGQNLQKPLVMGILNVTPDSFSDGGNLYVNGRLDPVRAVQRVAQMIEEGADIIDIGGESSGPGSKDISLEEELERVIPVLQAIRESIINDGVSSHLLDDDALDRTASQAFHASSSGTCIQKLDQGAFALARASQPFLISVDTYKAEVARQAIEVGADMINDVTALRGDEKMVEILAEFEVPVVLMYSKDSTARTTRENVQYDNVVATVANFFEERISYGVKLGIARERFIIDPGMGAFVSADPKYSLEILKRLSELKKFELPILVGASRKGFIGEVLSSITNYKLRITN